MSLDDVLQQSQCLVRWANSELELDSDEISDPCQLLARMMEGDGRRFVKLVGRTIEKSHDPTTHYHLQSLDDTIGLLADLNLIDNQAKDIFTSNERAFTSLLWKILLQFIVVAEFDDTRSSFDKNSRSVDMNVISSSAVKWAFSFAGPFVPRVLDQMTPNLSIIHDGKLLLAIINQGVSFSSCPLEGRTQ